MYAHPFHLPETFVDRKRFRELLSGGQMVGEVGYTQAGQKKIYRIGPNRRATSVVTHCTPFGRVAGSIDEAAANRCESHELDQLLDQRLEAL